MLSFSQQRALSKRRPHDKVLVYRAASQFSNADSLGGSFNLQRAPDRKSWAVHHRKPPQRDVAQHRQQYHPLAHHPAHAGPYWHHFPQSWPPSACSDCCSPLRPLMRALVSRGTACKRVTWSLATPPSTSARSGLDLQSASNETTNKPSRNCKVSCCASAMSIQVPALASESLTLVPGRLPLLIESSRNTSPISLPSH